MRLFDLLAGLGCYLYLMKMDSMNLEEMLEVVARAVERLIAIGKVGDRVLDENNGNKEID